MAYVKVDLHCPKCGNHPMVAQDDQCGGDYYAGENFVCPACNFDFSSPSIEFDMVKIEDDPST